MPQCTLLLWSFKSLQEAFQERVLLSCAPYRGRQTLHSQHKQKQTEHTTGDVTHTTGDITHNSLSMLIETHTKSHGVFSLSIVSQREGFAPADCPACRSNATGLVSWPHLHRCLLRNSHPLSHSAPDTRHRSPLWVLPSALLVTPPSLAGSHRKLVFINMHSSNSLAHPHRQSGV